MKLRQPTFLPSTELSATPSPVLWRQSFNVVTLTPIYGGGVKAGQVDAAMPARAAAIRGQLRFWWRLLKRHQPDHPIADSKTLFHQERALWGGMAEKEQDYASKVRLRINGIDSTATKDLIKTCAEYKLDGQGHRYRATPDFIPEVHSYALFPAKGELDDTRKEIVEDPAPVILAGLKFILHIECPLESQQEVIETLRWWASFGGLGARSRRGLGAMRVEGLLPVTKDEASHYHCRLEMKQSGKDAIKAWCKSLDALQHFRQGVGLGRNKGEEKNRPGRSRWPEPESIRAITGVHRVKASGVSFEPVNPNQCLFPRAAFGLPIIFHFQNITRGNKEEKDLRSDPADCELKPSEYDRMASPLIIKPMALADDQYAPIALRLPHSHLHDLTLELRNAGSNAHNPKLPLDLDKSEWWPLDKNKQQTLAEPIKPLWDFRNKDNSSDALDAFLNYFVKG